MEWRGQRPAPGHTPGPDPSSRLLWAGLHITQGDVLSLQRTKRNWRFMPWKNCYFGLFRLRAHISWTRGMFHSCGIQKELNAAENCAFSGTTDCAQETGTEKGGQNTLTQEKRQGVRLHVHCLQLIVAFSMCIPPKPSTKCPFKKSFILNFKCTSKEWLLDLLYKTIPKLFYMFCAFHTKHAYIFIPYLHVIYAMYAIGMDI